MLNQYFVKQALKEMAIEQFIRENFPMGDYSRIEIQRTPLGIKIVIHTNKPGRIIGRSGRTINEMTDAIKQKFGLENPQLDVKTIRNPDLDARIVAKQIVTSLEKGFNSKKIGNLALKRIMDAGAVGAEIVISGKFGTGKGMMSKFLAGYLKHCGQPAKELVDYGFEEANTKPGKIGVKVKIMKYFVGIDGEIRATKQEEMEQKGAEIVEEIEKVEEQKPEPTEEVKPEAKKKPKRSPKAPSERSASKQEPKKPPAQAEEKVKNPEEPKED